MKLFPMRDDVFIEPYRDIGEKVSAGGIVMPVTRREKGMTRGVVCATGPDVKHPDIKAGKTAYFDSRFCGQEVALKGKKKFLVMKEEFVIGVEE